MCFIKMHVKEISFVYIEIDKIDTGCIHMLDHMHCCVDRFVHTYSSFEKEVRLKEVILNLRYLDPFFI